MADQHDWVFLVGFALNLVVTYLDLVTEECPWFELEWRYFTLLYTFFTVVYAAWELNNRRDVTIRLRVRYDK